MVRSTEPDDRPADTAADRAGLAFPSAVCGDVAGGRFFSSDTGHAKSVAGPICGQHGHIYPDERSINNCIQGAAELVRTLGFAETANLLPRGPGLAG